MSMKVAWRGSAGGVDMEGVVRNEKYVFNISW
jgi:hypothetical protein